MLGLGLAALSVRDELMMIPGTLPPLATGSRLAYCMYPTALSNLEDAAVSWGFSF
jgi:hypothetical protein